MHLPILTPYGLDIKGGRFYAPSGFESVQAVKRPLLSVPYMFNYTPFTYFGFHTVLHVNPRLNLVNGAVEGGDRIFDEKYHYNYNGGFNWTSWSGRSTVASYILVRPEPAPDISTAQYPVSANRACSSRRPACRAEGTHFTPTTPGLTSTWSSPTSGPTS